MMSVTMVFIALAVCPAKAQSTKVSTTTRSSTATSSSTDSATPLPGSMEQASHPDSAVKKEEKEAKDKDKEKAAETPVPEQASLVRWYGHAFVYIINSTGVRVAMDPFARGSVKYVFPGRLPADTVLISTEADDHSAGELLFGTPQIFRSYTAVGLNKANGLLFKGVSVNRVSKSGPNTAKCTAFVFNLDGVNFCHLGVLGDTLDARQRQEIGRVDVLFLPIGNPDLSVSDLNKIVADLQAKIVIPIAYRTDFTPGLNLRTLDDYLKDQSVRGQKMPVKRLDKSEFAINPALLPSQPTLYIPAMP